MTNLDSKAMFSDKSSSSKLILSKPQLSGCMKADRKASSELSANKGCSGPLTNGIKGFAGNGYIFICSQVDEGCMVVMIVRGVNEVGDSAPSCRNANSCEDKRKKKYFKALDFP